MEPSSCSHSDQPDERGTMLPMFGEHLSEGRPAEEKAEKGPRALFARRLARGDVFDRRKAIVEDLRGQLNGVCTDMVTHGSNSEKIYQTRMLEVSLIQARRQFERAHVQLEDACDAPKAANCARSCNRRDA